MIVCMALSIGLVLAGCDNGSTGDGGDSGTSASSLTGIWVDDRSTPTTTYIFTNEDDPAITGSKVAYYSTNLTDEGANAAATGNQITVSETAYQYVLNGNTLTLTGYIPGVGGAAATDADFTRAKGSSGSTMHGIWISSLASGNARYTMIIIRSGTARTFTAVGSANWGESAYVLSSDANATFIKWGNGNPVAYTKYTNPDSLDITRPAGGGATDTGLITLASF